MASVIHDGDHTILVLFETRSYRCRRPEKLASIPERNREKISLLKVLTETLQRKLYVVHRLDKQVSGVIVFAKNPRPIALEHSFRAPPREQDLHRTGAWSHRGGKRSYR
jgi:23S rRNA-/tRNA-specific pseudouridylate synthase